MSPHRLLQAEQPRLPQPFPMGKALPALFSAPEALLGSVGLPLPTGCSPRVGCGPSARTMAAARPCAGSLLTPLAVGIPLGFGSPHGHGAQRGDMAKKNPLSLPQTSLCGVTPKKKKTPKRKIEALPYLSPAASSTGRCGMVVYREG